MIAMRSLSPRRFTAVVKGVIVDQAEPTRTCRPADRNAEVDFSTARKAGRILVGGRLWADDEIARPSLHPVIGTSILARRWPIGRHHAHSVRTQIPRAHRENRTAFPVETAKTVCEISLMKVSGLDPPGVGKANTRNVGNSFARDAEELELRLPAFECDTLLASCRHFDG